MIQFQYEFLSESDAISNKDKRNVSLILGVEAIFKIKINEAIYFEEGAIISMIPFSNKARVKTIWAKSNVYNVFDLDYIVNEFLDLEKKLKGDIESYFNIELGKFIKHIPYSING